MLFLKCQRFLLLVFSSFVLSQFPSTAPYTYNELTNLGPISRRYVKEQVDETASSIYFKARSLVNELKPMNAIAALREYRQPNAKLILELATLYNFVGNRSKAIAELERLRLVDPNGIRGMDLLASLYYANQLTNVSAITHVLLFINLDCCCRNSRMNCNLWLDISTNAIQISRRLLLPWRI